MKAKKIISFFLLALAILGIIGGIGYAVYNGAYPIAVGVAATGYLAWGGIVKCFKNLTS